MPVSTRAKLRDAPILPLFAAALVCGLAACAPERLPRPSPDFVVMSDEQSHRVDFEAGRLDLDEDAQRRLHAFARDNEISTAGEILVTGGEPERAARQAAVTAALRAAGAPAGSITAIETTGAPETESASTAVVVTLRIETVVPMACLEGGKLYSGQPPPGCINQLNLMHMVENPRDLLRGRDVGPGSAGRAIQAKDLYDRGSVEP